jgi:hypothetical protein
VFETCCCFTKYNKECTIGTHDLLVGTRQNIIPQGSLMVGTRQNITPQGSLISTYDIFSGPCPQVTIISGLKLTVTQFLMLTIVALTQVNAYIR